MPYAKAKDGTNLYYKDWGRGDPVVLLHGWPLTGDGRLVSASAHEMRSLRTSARCFRRSAHYGDDRTGRSGHPAL